jgi:hypothetical protein
MEKIIRGLSLELFDLRLGQAQAPTGAAMGHPIEWIVGEKTLEATFARLPEASKPSRHPSASSSAGRKCELHQDKPAMSSKTCRRHGRRQNAANRPPLRRQPFRRPAFVDPMLRPISGDGSRVLVVRARAKLTRRSIAARLPWHLIYAYCPVRSGRA